MVHSSLKFTNNGLCPQRCTATYQSVGSDRNSNAFIQDAAANGQSLHASRCVPDFGCRRSWLSFWSRCPFLPRPRSRRSRAYGSPRRCSGHTDKMTSMSKVTVGQPAPAFDCRAVVDGRIKGKHFAWSSVVCKRILTNTHRYFTQLLYRGQPLAHPSLLPSRMVLHLPNRGQGLQRPPGRVHLLALLRRRVRQYRLGVLSQSLECVFRHGRRTGWRPCPAHQR